MNPEREAELRALAGNCENYTRDAGCFNAAATEWGVQHPCGACVARIALDAIRDMRREADESEETRGRMRDILVAVAEGLRGPPPPGTSYDWSGLPKQVCEVRDAILDMHRKFTVQQEAYESQLLADQARAARRAAARTG